MASVEVSYAEARKRLAELCDQVVTTWEPIRLTRRDAPSIVLIMADEYDGLVETAHLLRSPANAARLLAALERARAGSGTPQPV